MVSFTDHHFICGRNLPWVLAFGYHYFGRDCLLPIAVSNRTGDSFYLSKCSQAFDDQVVHPAGFEPATF
jgi:hypothetical protein